MEFHFIFAGAFLNFFVFGYHKIFISINLTFCFFYKHNIFDTQYKFLIKDLQNVNRSVTPWLIICLHSPWYNTNKAHQREVEEVELRTLMEDVVRDIFVFHFLCIFFY